MDVIIAGSRDIQDYDVIKECINTARQKILKEFNEDITLVISGGARGPDKCGERWARENGIPVKRLYVSKEDWATYGKKAGHLRNERMAKIAQCVILIWDGISRGTENMFLKSRSYKLKIYLFERTTES